MPRNIPTVIDQMWRVWPTSILEIGCGFGLYGVLARQYMDVFGARVPYGKRATRIDAIEVYEPYISPLHASVYDNVYIGDAVDILQKMDAASYELILLIDVLEHFDKERGEMLLSECRRVADYSIIVVPYPPGPQGTVFGNEHEAHLSAWEPEELGPCEVIEKCDALTVLMHSDRVR